MRRLTVLAALALGIMILVPVASGARIVPQKGIGNVRLGGNETRLSDRLRPPDRVVRARGIVTGLPITLWYYSGLEIEFEGGNTVTKIRTTRIFDRTKKGAGINTPKKLLRKLHPRLRCGKGKFALCQMSKSSRGKTKVTTFELQDGAVASVTIWRVVSR